MTYTLVYGGLSSLGLALCGHLTSKGQNVLSLSSACNDKEREQEEERELFIGRNALFQKGSMEDLCNDEIRTNIQQAYFLDLNKDNHNERDLSYQKFEKLLERLLNQMDHLTSIIMVSENDSSRKENEMVLETSFETLFAKQIDEYASKSSIERAVVIKISEPQKDEPNHHQQEGSPLIETLESSIQMQKGFHILQMSDSSRKPDQDKILTYPFNEIKSFLK
ncbi:hypothetical protein [Scopulibacillus cellulosilyticus]|uniref:NAD(P)-dependent dehydrogenase (Short-subunit alcohol dehydrogenase family) n=1 Tax=Scopulibacillus cellulosilyticus TaxID=2665665 RepID=A0ABW2PUQ8_9BACL